ncbi:MAG: acyl-CoA desaturase [Gammaproteobacteria bacterium]|nr:acyl-CoA desaturase [Gammaproteobacteria bacterium]MBU2278470.1 acyl-CoA desaturase [Gammaproteobacteria bacterium]
MADSVANNSHADADISSSQSGEPFPANSAATVHTGHSIQEIAASNVRQQTGRFSEAQASALAADLDALASATRDEVGSADSRYLLKIVQLQRVAAISGRLLMVAGFWSAWWWGLGVLFLALAKILDNMEIGHNVLHGQYDFMNHPYLNSRTFEWDIACDAKSWQRTHNYEHHTYTNIIGKDRDFGYGLLRLSDDFRWRLQNSWQILTYFLLSTLFQWGVSYHEMAAERVFFGRKKADRVSQISDAQLKKAFFGKGGRQLLKDYLLFPLLSGPMFFPVLAGNFLANLLRNWWTSTIIFCGHFTSQVHVFTPDVCVNESRGHWYYRQMLGSANFTGPRWFHILSGHLSCQIEHHLFPDLPAYRYLQLAPQVAAIAKKHGIAYHSGSFVRQYLSVLQRILRFSLPGHDRQVASSM